MATKTLRPLKKGDKCWIRIQREGRPVLATYDEPAFARRLGHFVLLGREIIHVTGQVNRLNKMHRCRRAIFVAKPIPKDAP